MAEVRTMPRVRIGVMTVGQLGDLVEVLKPYRQHSATSHVLPRAVRFMRRLAQAIH